MGAIRYLCYGAITRTLSLACQGKCRLCPTQK